MNGKILTLCQRCVDSIKAGGYEVKLIPHQTTTEKKTACENCRMKYNHLALNSHLVKGRRAGA